MLWPKKVNESFAEYRFDHACSTIYQFTYEKFCSWYIEFSKPILYGDHQEKKIVRATVLNYCLKKIMAILHPIAPFISEEIWQYIKDDKDPMLITTEYPQHDERYLFQQDQLEMNRFIEAVTKIRNLRQSVNLPPQQEIDLEIFTNDQEFCDYLNRNSKFLFNLVRAKDLQVKEKSWDRPKKSIMAATPLCEILIPLTKVIDLAEQINRLQKELAKTQKELTKFEKKLSNKNFIEKAPESVILETREKAKKYRHQLENIEENLGAFQT